MLEFLCILPKGEDVYWIVLKDDLCKGGYHLLWIVSGLDEALECYKREALEIVALTRSGHLV